MVSEGQGLGKANYLLPAVLAVDDAKRPLLSLAVPAVVGVRTELQLAHQGG